MNDHVINISKPIHIHLSIPHNINHRSIFHAGIGETKSSSIDFWNLAPKNDPEVFQ